MDSSRFISLWQRNISDSSEWDGARVFQQLDKLYAEAPRRYHNGEHIALCLQLFDAYRDTADDADAVELAIWFHDACYGPEPVGHESRSARLFRNMSGEGLSAERQNRICQLIMDTTHQQPPADEDGALLVDIDLGSFCQPWHPYLKDTARCRAERKHLADEEFCNCQLGFLRSLLDRTSVYYSDVFKSNHESQARENIEKLIELLTIRAAAG